jgi:hypothetical protein
VYWQRAAFCCALFLWAKELSDKDIHKEMFPVYSGRCLSCKARSNWVKKFFQGRMKMTDDAQLGCPVEIATEVTLQ